MFLWRLAWREFIGDKLLWGLSSASLAIGVAVVISAEIVKSSLLSALESSEDAQLMWAGITDQLNANLTATGIAITLATGFIVFNAFGISFARRRRRLATLRSIGMTKPQLFQLGLFEALFTGTLGVALGLAAGPILAWMSIKAITAVTSEGQLVFEPGPPSSGAILLALILGFIISLLAAVQPALQASRVSPLAARRPLEAKGLEHSKFWIGWVALAGMLLVLIYLRNYPPGEELEPPWDVRGAIIFIALWLGLVTLLVSVAAGALGTWTRGLLGRLAGASGFLMADNLRRTRRRVSLTVLSLTFALALVVGLVGFTRFTIESLMVPIIKRAAGLGAWVVTGFDPLAGMSAFQGLDELVLRPEDLTAIQAVVGDRATSFEVRYAAVPELSFFGSSFFSFLITPEQADQEADWLFEFEQGDWENAKQEMEQGCGVLVLPGVANEIGADFGDRVTVTGAEGPVECVVAGIGSGFVTASVIGTANPGDFQATDPMLVVVTPVLGADRIALGAELDHLAPALHVSVMERVTGAISGLLEQIPIVLNGMTVMAVLAAGLGVVNTLTASVVERRGEFGLFRAVGASRRQVRWVVVGEAAMMSAVGAGIGIIAGLGLAVIMPTVYGGNGWGMRDLDHWAAAVDAVRVALPIGLAGWLFAILIGGLAGLLTVQGMLRRRRLVDELQAEKH